MKILIVLLILGLVGCATHNDTYWSSGVVRSSFRYGYMKGFLNMQKAQDKTWTTDDFNAWFIRDSLEFEKILNK